MVIQSIQKIKESIQKWEQIRNTDLGLNFLTSGIGFRIEKKEFQKWLDLEEKNGEISNIHLYIGIVEFEMVFYLVDSSTEKNGFHNPDDYKVNENLFIKEITKNISSSIDMSPVPHIQFSEVQATNKITEQEVMKRIFKWYLFGTTWFNNDRKKNMNVAKINNQEYQGVLKCMTIPFSDLKYLFGKYSQETLFCFFGLREEAAQYTQQNATNTDIIELILCTGETTNNTIDNSVQNTVESFADVTRPSPPFYVNDFNLFNV